MPDVRLEELPPAHVLRSRFTRGVYILVAAFVCNLTCFGILWFSVWVREGFSSEFLSASLPDVGKFVLVSLFALVLSGTPALAILLHSDVTRSVRFTFFWTVVFLVAFLGHLGGALYVAYFGGLLAMVLARCFYPLPKPRVEPWSDLP